MPSALTIFLEYVCPAFGAITANLMFFAPVRDVQAAVVRGDGLGSLNPFPWVFMLSNTIGWIAYGLMIENAFVFMGNAPGLIAAVWLNLQAAKLQYESLRSKQWKASIVKALEQKNGSLLNDENTAKRANQTQEMAESTVILDMIVTTPERSDMSTLVLELPPQQLVPPCGHDVFVLANAGLWLVVLAVLVFGNVASSTREFVVGMITNSLCVVFYASPLSAIGNVLRQRNASTIHIPTMMTNTLNGVFWAAYGFTVSDHFISVPNSLGAALGGIQILLCLVFPRNTKNEETPKVEEAVGTP